MDTGIILNLINRHFNGVTGIILTGSQVDAPVLNVSTDIDVMLIDPRFSTTTAKVIRIDKFDFDFTMMPLLNIDNILRNECYDTKGILLSMLIRCLILKDNETGIIQKIKDRAMIMYDRGTVVGEQHFNKSTDDLIRLRKDFYREAGYEKRMVDINNFFFQVIQVELSRFNWQPSAKHKADFLFKHRPDFMKDIIRLLEQTLSEKGTKDNKDVGEYIGNYLHDKTSRFVQKKPTMRCVLDLRYDSINLTSFVTDILPKIRDNKLLGNRYLHFFITPTIYHHLYKKYLCITFRTDENIKSGHILNTFKNLAQELGLTGLVISLLPELIFTDPFFDVGFLFQFEPVACSISEMCSQQLKLNGEDQEKTFVIAVILLSFLTKALVLSIEDAFRINSASSDLALFTRDEQRKFSSFNDFIAAQNKKRKQFAVYVATNQELLTGAFKKGASYAGPADPDTSKEYYPVIEALKTLMSADLDHNALSQNNPVYFGVLSDWKVISKQTGLFYHLIARQLLLSLNLSPTHYALCYFVVATQALEEQQH